MAFHANYIYILDIVNTVDHIAIHKVFVDNNLLPPLIKTVEIEALAVLSMGIVATLCTSKEHDVQESILRLKLIPYIAALRLHHNSQVQMLAKGSLVSLTKTHRDQANGGDK